MEQASSAQHVIVAALFTIVAAVITTLVIGSWDSNIVTPVILSTFLTSLLTPFFNRLLTARKTHRKTKPAVIQASVTGETRTLYVGNLPFKADEDDITQLFAAYGPVHAVRLVKDRRTGRRKGYGFIEMEANAAESALKKLNDSEFDNRTIKVRAAHSETDEE